VFVLKGPKLTSNISFIFAKILCKPLRCVFVWMHCMIKAPLCMGGIWLQWQLFSELRDVCRWKVQNVANVCTGDSLEEFTIAKLQTTGPNPCVLNSIKSYLIIVELMQTMTLNGAPLQPLPVLSPQRISSGASLFPEYINYIWDEGSSNASKLVVFAIRSLCIGLSFLKANIYTLQHDGQYLGSLELLQATQIQSSKIHGYASFSQKVQKECAQSTFPKISIEAVDCVKYPGICTALIFPGLNIFSLLLPRIDTSTLYLSLARPCLEYAMPNLWSVHSLGLWSSRECAKHWLSSGPQKARLTMQR